VCRGYDHSGRDNGTVLPSSTDCALLKGGERASDEVVRARSSSWHCALISPQRISDQNSRYGMSRPWCAVRGPSTPHPVPCRVKHLLQNTVHSSSSHLSPQPTSPVSLKYPYIPLFAVPTSLFDSPMTSLYPPSGYRPPVIRQEGFHLPSASSTSGNNPPSPSQASFDSNGQLFMPQLLSDPFRKLSGDPTTPSMDFSEELASLIAQSPAPHTSHQSSHERSTHTPPSNASGPQFDDSSYRPQATHNIFDISATNNNQHQQQQHPPPHAHNNFSGQFVLNPAQTQPPAQQYHNLHEFNPHPHFNSTLPALNSTMRYDPQPPQTHPPAHEHPNPPSFTNHFSPTSSEFTIRHSPSPVGFTSNTSRSRSRSRAPATPAVNPEPPSTNGGPTRTIRHKRNSISSVSPPPHHRTQAIVIPSSHPHRAASQHTPTSATSPLSLHALNENSSNWFVPSQQQQAHDFRHNEFSLPASETVGNHHSFAQFNPGSVGSAVSLGVSPKDVAAAKVVNGADSEDDAVSKQCVDMILPFLPRDIRL